MLVEVSHAAGAGGLYPSEECGQSNQYLLSAACRRCCHIGKQIRWRKGLTHFYVGDSYPDTYDSVIPHETSIHTSQVYSDGWGAADLSNFSNQWGLPAANFTKIYCDPVYGCTTYSEPPASNKGWGLEEALDIEWSHAMAPSARICTLDCCYLWRVTDGST